MDRILDRLAILVTRRRVAVVAVVLLVTGALASRIPDVRPDPSPQALVADYGDHAGVAAAFGEHFGDSDRVVVLLVRAPDILDLAPLQYVHDLSVHFADERSVARVESITTSPIARRTGRSASADLTLDDLEIEEEDVLDAPPEIIDALHAVARAEPDRFPDGISSLGPILDEIVDTPLVAGTSVTRDEATTAGRVLDRSPLILGRLLSRDHRVAAVVLWLADDSRDHAAMDGVVERIDRWLAAHPPPAGTELLTGGLPHLRVAIVDKMASDQVLLVPITLLVCLVLLYLSFRWLPGTVLPIVTVGLTAAAVVGGMGLVHEPMNILNNIIPPLLIIIGISDSIHLINRYREELPRAPDRTEAARRTVRSMAVACLLTSVTTAVGLGSLVVSQTKLLRHFGLTAAIGVMVAYVITITFVPAVMTGLRPPRARDAGATADGWIERFAVATTAWILRRPWPVLSAAAVLLGLCIWGAWNVRVDTALMDQFDPDEEVYRSTRLMEEELDGARPLEILIRSTERGHLTDPGFIESLDGLRSWIERQPGVLRTASASDYLYETRRLLGGNPTPRARFRSAEQVDALVTLLGRREPNPLSDFLSADGQSLRVQVKMADVGAKATSTLIKRLRGRLDAGPAARGRVTYGLTGEAYTGSLAVESVVDDLLGSLGLAVVVIFGVLALLFRSLRLGLLSIPPNVFPLLGTVAWMVLRGIALNIATVIIFSISIGLAVDGTIHVLARFREEVSRGLEADEALLRSARGTGRAIVVSSITLVLGFGVLLFSAFVPVRHFGELVAVTVAGCLVATLVVLPALLKVGAGRPSSAVTPEASRAGPEPRRKS